MFTLLPLNRVRSPLLTISRLISFMSYYNVLLHPILYISIDEFVQKLLDFNKIFKSTYCNTQLNLSLIPRQPYNAFKKKKNHVSRLKQYLMAN